MALVHVLLAVRWSARGRTSSHLLLIETIRDSTGGPSRRLLHSCSMRVHGRSDEDSGPSSQHALRAVQALYNIAKTSREAFLTFFPEVFDALFRLCADAEPNVKNAASFLDSFVKVCRLLRSCA